MRPIKEFLQLPWPISKRKETAMSEEQSETIDNYDHDGFTDFLAADPDVDQQVTSTEWEVLRYRHRSSKALGTVYKNKAGRITLTGAAIEDYRRFTNA